MQRQPQGGTAHRKKTNEYSRCTYYLHRIFLGYNFNAADRRHRCGFYVDYVRIR